VILFVAVFAFVYINQYDIQFTASGLNKMASAETQVYCLDVGQASASLLIFPTRRTMLIDTGSEDSSDEFLRDVDKILTENNLSVIDILVLTHSDEDHVGGALKLLEKYQVNNVYRPKLISLSAFDERGTGYNVVTTQIYKQVITAIYKEPDCTVSFINDKTFVEGEGCTVTFYSCSSYLYSAVNSYCPYIVVEAREKVFLFCGDAPSEREEEFLNRLKLDGTTLQVDFLFVPHHGAKDGSSEDFLSAISPRYALVSAGDAKYPTSAVTKRLLASGVEKIYVTRSDGTIGIAVQESGAFSIYTMSNPIDLPLVVCAIFFVGAAWNYYLSKRKRRFFTLK
jgi:competence protein ComEC